MTPAELKAARKRLGMSQALLAQQLGVTTQTVSRWERGAVKVPGPVAKLIEMMEKQDGC